MIIVETLCNTSQGASGTCDACQFPPDRLDLSITNVVVQLQFIDIRQNNIVPHSPRFATTVLHMLMHLLSCPCAEGLVGMLHMTMHLSHPCADTCLLGCKGASTLAEAIQLHGGRIWTPASTEATDVAVVLVTADLQSPDLCDVPTHITDVQTTTVNHLLVSLAAVYCAADKPYLGLVNAYAACWSDTVCSPALPLLQLLREQPCLV